MVLTGYWLVSAACCSLGVGSRYRDSCWHQSSGCGQDQCCDLGGTVWLVCTGISVLKALALSICGDDLNGHIIKSPLSGGVAGNTVVLYGLWVPVAVRHVGVYLYLEMFWPYLCSRSSVRPSICLPCCDVLRLIYLLRYCCVVYILPFLCFRFLLGDETC